MLATTMMMGACTSDDSWDDSWYGDDDTSTEETTTSAYSEMKTFTIATDKTTAEPVSTSPSLKPCWLLYATMPFAPSVKKT